MRLKREKCSFLLPSVEYLGHVISAEGLKTSESKVKAVTNAPTPTSVSELRSFLGLVNYYSKFLPDLASIHCIACYKRRSGCGRSHRRMHFRQ